MSEETVEISFPCTGCGTCCKHVDRGIKALDVEPDDPLFFPFDYDETGRCVNLTDDNRCSIYEKRPLICNIAAVAEYLGYDKEKFFARNVIACNKMMDADNVPSGYRII